jgi:hypothetical protein
MVIIYAYSILPELRITQLYFKALVYIAGC